MSINIEQAVEAAAKALYGEHPDGGGPWEEISPWRQFLYKEQVTPIVDAAVNSIAAQAWKQGYDAAFEDMFSYGSTENPYVEEEA